MPSGGLPALRNSWPFVTIRMFSLGSSHCLFGFYSLWVTSHSWLVPRVSMAFARQGMDARSWPLGCGSSHHNNLHSHCGCSPRYYLYSSTCALGESKASSLGGGQSSTHWEDSLGAGCHLTCVAPEAGEAGMAVSCSECSLAERDPWGKETHSTCKMQFSSAHPGCSWLSCLVSLPAAPAPSV